MPITVNGRECDREFQPDNTVVRPGGFLVNDELGRCKPYTPTHDDIAVDIVRGDDVGLDHRQ